MNRLLMRCALLVAGSIWLLSADGPRLHAQSPETSPSVTGTWNGSFGSPEGQETTPTTLVIPFQDHRRFVGMMSVGNAVYQIAGTVSASDQLILVGKGEGELGVLIGLLQLQALENSATILDGRLRLHSPGGEMAVDEVHLLRDFRPE
jgi:hypothetical protein